MGLFVIKEKKHRLDREYYLGTKTIAFTCCIQDKKDLFQSSKIFLIFEEILLRELEFHRLGTLVYLFMPDHLHLITIGKDNCSNPLDFMKRFKQKTGFWLAKNMNGFKWQKDFYDHIIREENDIKNQIYYILNNPVRKEFATHWKDYPYKGSTEFDLNVIEYF